jgi:hypothetical protein
VAFIRLARHHGVLALTYSSLQATCPDAVPPAIGDPLSRYVTECGERNRQLAGRLVDLLALLDAHRIPAVPVKGPVLAAAVYGDLALRECVALDILVRRQDALRASGLFVSAGYELRTKVDARGLPADFNDQYEYEFTHSADRLNAELTWRITPVSLRGTLGLEYLGERRQPILLAGVQVATLPPEENLLLLCVHATKHYWGLLKWVCDVAELVGMSPELDWRRVQALAKPLGCWRAVTLGLVLAHDLLDVPFPAAISVKVKQEAGARRLAMWVQTRLLQDDGNAHEGTRAAWYAALKGEWELRRYWLRLAERVLDKLWNWVLALRLLGLVARLLIPTDKDREVVPLPARLSWLYFPVRSARVVLQYGVRPAVVRLSAIRKVRS